MRSGPEQPFDEQRLNQTKHVQRKMWCHILFVFLSCCFPLAACSVFLVFFSCSFPSPFSLYGVFVLTCHRYSPSLFFSLVSLCLQFLLHYLVVLLLICCLLFVIPPTSKYTCPNSKTPNPLSFENVLYKIQE